MTNNFELVFLFVITHRIFSINLLVKLLSSFCRVFVYFIFLKMSNDVKYDPNRFDRQIFALGNKAMEKITSSSVLISGLGGVGLEIAKNIILSGVKSITLHDTEKMTINDLSSHFYADKDSIGQNRAFASKSKLSELWDMANIQVLEKKIKLRILSKILNLIALSSQLLGHIHKSFQFRNFAMKIQLHLFL